MSLWMKRHLIEAFVLLAFVVCPSINMLTSSALKTGFPATTKQVSAAIYNLLFNVLFLTLLFMHKGLRMRAFSERIDEESNSSSDKSSFHSVSPPPEPMSFNAESQESIAFPSYNSKELDTGYATGSISSSQNVMTSVGNGGTLSRITPVTELMEDCGISRSDMSMDSVAICSEPVKQIDTVSSNLISWPWFPTKCSTPTKTYNF